MPRSGWTVLRDARVDIAAATWERILVVDGQDVLILGDLAERAAARAATG